MLSMRCLKWPSGAAAALAVGGWLAGALWASPALAYETYSTNGSTGNCASCHGDFRAAGYTSRTDGSLWGGNLHDPHRNTWLGGQCNVCHAAAGRSPVFLNTAVGIAGLPNLSCSGCHAGAGLRQHHIREAAVSCTGASCHATPNPPAESVNPPFYGNALGQIPANACDTAAAPRDESKFGTVGLDNDGDGLYDGADPDCRPLVETCDNNRDDDGDGLADCADPDCGGFRDGACTTGQPGVCSAGTFICQNLQRVCVRNTDPVPEQPPGSAICANGLDDDCDGAADAADTGCQFPPEANCFDGLDNNGNGLVDCADSSCANVVGPVTSCGVGLCAADGNLVCQNGQRVNTCTPGTPVPESPPGSAVCADQQDNDCDNLTDAADPDCQFPPEANCFDGLDNNGNGLVDCADASCANATGPVTTCGVGICARAGNLTCFQGQQADTCVPGQPGTEGPFFSPTCNDGLDNDCDGFTDATDTNSCAVTAEGNCFDGLDNNGDGLVDCADPTCAGVVGPATTCGVGVCASTGNLVCNGGQQQNTCVAGTPGTESPPGSAVCQDGLDNDCDGATDANDAGCVGPEICDNGIDDDFDGLADCADPDCAGFQAGACQTGQPGVCADGTLTCRNLQQICVANQQAAAENLGAGNCGDGLDNDCDGFTDGNDDGCVLQPEADCFDGTDNNLDGLTDCADPTCANVTGPISTCGVGACAAVGNLVCLNGVQQNTCVPGTPGVEGPFNSPTCADGADNDCDGLTDAADTLDCVAPPEVCDNQIDDNANGAIDCQDGQCAGVTFGACNTGLPGVCAAGTLTCDGTAIGPVCRQNQQPGTEGPFGNATCNDGLDNDCDGLTDAADQNCAAPPVDFVINRLQASNNINLNPRNPRAVTITLTIQNVTAVQGTAQATVEGVQNGAQVYSVTRTVTDAPGNGSARIDFPAYTPTVAGTITWTVTVVDANQSTAIATTTVR